MVEPTEDPPTARRCETCGTPLVPSDGPGRPARYCSNGCKTQAYWQRKLARDGEGALVEMARGQIGESTATQPSGCDHSKAKKGPLAGTLRCPCGMVRGKDQVWR